MMRVKGSSSRWSLVAATAVISAVLLEVGLRLVGPAVVLWRARPAHMGGEDFRILTLGESTTADDSFNVLSWPKQLEEMLQAKGVNARVLNVAEAGITSIELLERLPRQLDSWKPHLVISMMGINDAPHVFSSVVGKSAWNSIYLIRFAKAFWILARGTIVDRLTLRPERFSFPETTELIGRLRNGKDPKALLEAEQLVQRLSSPRDRARYLAYLGLELLPPSGAPEGDYDLAHRLLLRSHELYAGVDRVSWELAYQASKFKRYDECIRIARDYYALWIQPDSENVSRVFFRCKLASPKRPGWAQVTVPEPFAVSNGNSWRATQESHLRLANLLESRGIRYFAMAYPRQNVEELKSYFSASSSRVHFISNAEAFESALKTAGWDRLFVDRFAGSFGHATNEGNRLIAQAAVAAILPVIGSRRTSPGG